MEAHDFTKFLTYAYESVSCVVTELGYMC